MRIARAPQQLATRLAERVERAEQRKVAQRLLFKTDAPRELVEAGERAVHLTFMDDPLGLGLAQPLHRLETEPHVVNSTRPAARDRVGAVDRMQRVTLMRALFDDRLLLRT